MERGRKGKKGKEGERRGGEAREGTAPFWQITGSAPGSTLNF